MAVPNNLSKYLFPIYESLLDYSITNDIEMSIRNGTIMLGDNIFWCIGKHMKCDRLRNNLEWIVSFKSFREVEFDSEMISNIIYGKAHEFTSIILFTGKSNSCDNCRTKFIKVNLYDGTIIPFCIHKLKIILDA